LCIQLDNKRLDIINQDARCNRKTKKLLLSARGKGNWLAKIAAVVAVADSCH
jgi:hypothetical protein